MFCDRCEPRGPCAVFCVQSHPVTQFGQWRSDGWDLWIRWLVWARGHDSHTQLLTCVPSRRGADSSLWLCWLSTWYHTALPLALRVIAAIQQLNNSSFSQCILRKEKSLKRHLGPPHFLQLLSDCFLLAGQSDLFTTNIPLGALFFSFFSNFRNTINSINKYSRDRQRETALPNLA